MKLINNLNELDILISSAHDDDGYAYEVRFDNQHLLTIGIDDNGTVSIYFGALVYTISIEYSLLIEILEKGRERIINQQLEWLKNKDHT